MYRIFLISGHFSVELWSLLNFKSRFCLFILHLIVGFNIDSLRDRFLSKFDRGAWISMALTREPSRRFHISWTVNEPRSWIDNSDVINSVREYCLMMVNNTISALSFSTLGPRPKKSFSPSSITLPRFWEKKSKLSDL